jgi:hypothetical protein
MTVLYASNLLMFQGKDVRTWPLGKRRGRLEEIVRQLPDTVRFFGISEAFLAVVGRPRSSGKSLEVPDFAGESSTFLVVGCESSGRLIPLAGQHRSRMGRGLNARLAARQKNSLRRRCFVALA